MKHIYLLLLVLLFSLAYCSTAKTCVRHHGCLTKNFHSYSHRHLVKCPNTSSCRGYACIFKNVIYKGSGCFDDDRAHCEFKGAIIIEDKICKSAKCELNIDIDVAKYSNLSKKLCDYVPEYIKILLKSFDIIRDTKH